MKMHIRWKYFQMSQWKVEYCHNCDGGAQEMNTAISAIKEVLPNANVQGVGLDVYPIQVRIIAPDGKVIWADKQQKLFKKYPQDRLESIQQIKSAVQATLK